VWLFRLWVACTPIGVALGATLSPTAEYAATSFDVSSNGTQIATILGDTVCVRPIGVAGDTATCYDFALRGIGELRELLWAPGDRSLAVAGTNTAGASAIWILDTARGLRRVTPPVWSAGTRSQNEAINLQAWIDPDQVVFRGIFGFGVVRAGGPRPSIATCAFTEADGFFKRVSGQPTLLGSDRFGDMLQVIAGDATRDAPNLSCVTVGPSHTAPTNDQWLRFEDALTASQLLFSKQHIDRGANWRLGAELVALDSRTLQPITGAWPVGAPASVSPDGHYVAALRRSDSSVSIAIYRRPDWVITSDVPVAARADPTTDIEWERMSPQWSKDGRFVLVWFGLERFGTVLISALDGRFVASLPGEGGLHAYQWAADNRLVAQDGSRVVVYELED
jgi:hypothetical protein